VPGTCWFAANIRVPPGLGKEGVRATIQQILARYPEAAVEALTDSAPSLCDPNHPMVGILRANAVALVRPAPASIVRLGGTDARL
jgi:acetylornithine deacetylase/succinyl-diaminopimelate desuccinylase-like protein